MITYSSLTSIDIEQLRQTLDFAATGKYERSYSSDIFELSPAALCSVWSGHTHLTLIWRNWEIRFFLAMCRDRTRKN